MKIWESDFGETFEDEQEARDDICDKMEWSDYEEKLKPQISWSTLFEWAREQPGFFERFENEIYDAEIEFFLENYHEKEVEDENEE